jgi:hypothetical protein
MRREQKFWKSSPSDAASVASKNADRADVGEVWNAALTSSRFSESMPPYIVSSRSPPVKPSTDKTS